jgi:phosphomannomutase
MACNQSTSRMIEQVAAGHGFPFRRTPVGEINVVAGLQSLEAAWRRSHPGDDTHFSFGGEGGGGVIDPRNQYCRDSLNAMALILQGLAAWKRADRGGTDDLLLLDAWRRAVLPPCAIHKATLAFADLDGQSHALAAVASALTPQAASPRDLMTDDGIRLRFADQSWVHVRASNTEPIVRFIAEHDSLARAKALVAGLMQLARRAAG